MATATVQQVVADERSLNGRIIINNKAYRNSKIVTAVAWPFMLWNPAINTITNVNLIT
jgi:hypothetical protein